MGLELASYPAAGCRLRPKADAATMALPVPGDNAVFAEREYWDSRFAVEEQYDWLNTYDAYAHILREKVRRRPSRSSSSCALTFQSSRPSA